MNTLFLAASMFLSNDGASKVLSLLDVQISNDTIQRLYDRIGFVDNPDVKEVGIDDVAIQNIHSVRQQVQTFTVSDTAPHEADFLCNAYIMVHPAFHDQCARSGHCPLLHHGPCQDNQDTSGDEKNAVF